MFGVNIRLLRYTEPAINKNLEESLPCFSSHRKQPQEDEAHAPYETPSHLIRVRGRGEKDFVLPDYPSDEQM